jgi:hypothetical protein
MDGLKSNTVWIFLRDARKLVADRRYGGALGRAGSWLEEQLAEGRMPSRYQDRKPHGPDEVRLWCSPPSAADDNGDDSWLDPTVWVRPNLTEVRWDESSAWWDGFGGYDLFGIEVPLAAVEALLPAAVEPEAPVEQPPLPAEEPESPAVQNTASWIAAEARQLKHAGKIPAGIIKTEFAKMLVDQMGKAARAKRLPTQLRPVTSGYLKDKLSDWDLWPIDKI